MDALSVHTFAVAKRVSGGAGGGAGGAGGDGDGTVWDGASVADDDDSIKLKPHPLPARRMVIKPSIVESMWGLMPRMIISALGKEFCTYPFDAKCLCDTQVVCRSTNEIHSLRTLLADKGARITKLLVNNTTVLECVGPPEAWALSRMFRHDVLNHACVPLGLLACGGAKINMAVAATGSPLLYTLGLLAYTSIRSHRVEAEHILMISCNVKRCTADLVRRMTGLSGKKPITAATTGSKRTRDEEEEEELPAKKKRLLISKVPCPPLKVNVMMLMSTENAMVTERAVRSGPHAVHKLVLQGIAPGSSGARASSVLRASASSTRAGGKGGGAGGGNKRRTCAPALAPVIRLGAVDTSDGGATIIAIENVTRGSDGVSWVTAHAIGQGKSTRIEADRVRQLSIAEPPRGSTFYRSSKSDAAHEFELFVAKSKGPYAVRGLGAKTDEDFAALCAPFEVTVNMVRDVASQIDEFGVRDPIFSDMFVPDVFLQGEDAALKKEKFAVVNCARKDDGLTLLAYLGAKGCTVVPLCEGSTLSSRHKYAFLQRVKKSTPLSNEVPSRVASVMREELKKEKTVLAVDNLKGLLGDVSRVETAGDLLMYDRVPLARSWVEYGARCALAMDTDECNKLPPTLRSYAMVGRAILEDRDESEVLRHFVFTRAPAIPNQMLEVVYRCAYWSKYHRHLDTIGTPWDVCAAFRRDVATAYGVVARETGNYEHALVAAPGARGRVITRTWEMFIGTAWCKQSTL